MERKGFNLIDDKKVPQQSSNFDQAQLGGPPRAPAVKKVLEQPYYVARLTDDGHIEGGDERKQFIVTMGSEVRFQLDYGTKISKEAKLLVNKPKKQADGGAEYTMTQPLTREGDDGMEEFQGSALDLQHLEMVEPHLGSSQYMMEFRMLFDESGSFFVQVAYKDDHDEEAFTPPQYINVEPLLSINGRPVRPKELSIITVMSRCLGKMDRWNDVLRAQGELGYNAVHFAPFQQYGESHSHYSIANQLTVDDCYFATPKAVPAKARFEALSQVTETLRK
jgi:hypothetical protein